MSGAIFSSEDFFKLHFGNSLGLNDALSPDKAQIAPLSWIPQFEHISPFFGAWEQCPVYDELQNVDHTATYQTVSSKGYVIVSVSWDKLIIYLIGTATMHKLYTFYEFSLPF